jgi:predicted GH43/DUF377 family glycosyl hydrolase
MAFSPPWDCQRVAAADKACAPIHPLEENKENVSKEILEPLSKVERLMSTPILSPSKGAGFYDAGAFNPSAMRLKSKTILLFRAQDKKGISSIGFASSSDGLHFQIEDRPVLAAEEAYEKGGGIEDPRLHEIEKKYYLTYTGYNGKDAQLCLALSEDLRHFNRLGVIMPAYKGTWNKQWTKSGAIVGQKINGKYWMYYLGTANNVDEMGLASSADLIHWTDATDKPVLPHRSAMFDSRVVEPGPAPIITGDGILLIYNGADDKLVYRTGWALFDKQNPSKLIARSQTPIFEPSESWELDGQVPNVVFVEGAIQVGKKLRLYYGGADKFTGVAEATLR